jgi:serine phosphatase RsbU (regulator of sigma subunit)
VKIILYIQTLFLILVVGDAGGSKIDSLIRLAQTEPNDTQKVALLFDISQKHQRTGNDSLYSKYLDSVYQLATDLNYKRGLVEYYDEIGYQFRKRSAFKEALEAHLKALKMSQEIGYKAYLPRIYNNIGVVYRRLDEYNQAVEYHLKALSAGEKYGDNRSQMYARNSLGNVFALMKRYEQAMIYFRQALSQATESGNLQSLAINYNNIGELLETKGDYNEALKYYFKSFEYNQQNNSKIGIAISYDCIGSVYAKMGIHSKAISFFEQALKLNREIGDRIYENVSLQNIGDSYAKLHQDSLAILFLKNALYMAAQIGSKSVERDAHKSLSRIYERKGHSPLALAHYKDYVRLKDDIFNEVNSKNISKLQTLYDTEKQRREIAMLEQEKLQREKANQLKNTFIIILAVVISFLSFLAFFLYRGNKIKRRNNDKLRNQSALISQKNAQLNEKSVQMEQINRKITDSLLYAERIQQALLPQNNLLDSLFIDHFVFYLPLNVVSGDFYWAGRYKNKALFTVADCTGHGVPGAMMSMLGSSYLSETIRNPNVTTANEMLDQMRDMIISSLHQQGAAGESRDGMELSICLYDPITQILEFAGAHISIYIATKPNQKEPFRIIELNGDRMPIGYYRFMKPFTYQTYKVQPDDIVYLFTDGYIDQFGGEKGRRFQTRRFKQLLVENAHKPMEEQQEIIRNTFYNWKGDGEQIDDVLVVGLKLPVG